MAKPARRGHVFIELGADRSVRTERRPDRGLLGGMMGLPTSDWGAEATAPKFPSEGNWQDVGEVRHVFTHFSLTLTVWCLEQPAGDFQTSIVDAADGLPSVFAKALKLAVI